jgi:2-polyprenyl-3-methyl-5-hydroxy-6-metoxy-1,4-benzoquinol methylase
MDCSHQMSDLTCQLCGGAAFMPLMDVEDANFSSRIKRYAIRRCKACGLSTMNPFPVQRDVEELYVKEGVFSVRTDNPYRRKFSFRVFEPLYQKYGTDLRFIATRCLGLNPVANPSILDIGCSVGRVLDAFKRAAPRLDVSRMTGIDIDPNAVVNAIPYLRDRIVIGDFLKHDFPGRFDIVTMRYVIEHLLDFVPYISRAITLLQPGGILFFSTPDIDSAQAQLLREKWNLINDPKQKIGHLRWFNRKSIEFLAAKFGLRIEKCVNRGEMIYHLPLSIQRLLRKLLGTEPRSGRFIRRYTPRIINATFIDGLLSQTLSRGEGLYVFLRKP